MQAKAEHKLLKRQVNEVEEIRNNDRSITSWMELRHLKKLKLKAKDKLNGIKQKFYA